MKFGLEGTTNIFDAGSATIRVAGDWVNSNNGTVFPGTSTVIFDGISGTSTVTPGSATFYNVAIEDGNGGGDLTVLMAGTLNLMGTFDMGGTLSIYDGILDLDGHELYVSG